MVNLPLNQEALQELQTKTQEIRALAQSHYREILKQRIPPNAINSDYVRTNIFLPDNREAQYGEVCGLFIPSTLQAGMNNENERRIRFRTKEGVTGQVYSEQRPIGARRKTKNGSKWERIEMTGNQLINGESFPLTQEQIALTDRNLQWIVSIPIEITRDGVRHTIRVFNVDGLEELLKPGEMRNIYSELDVQVKQIAKILDKLPQCRVTIFVDNLRE